MSKAQPFANEAFKLPIGPALGFHLAPQVNSFNSLFDLKPLDQSEAIAIEQLLCDNWEGYTGDQEQEGSSSNRERSQWGSSGSEEWNFKADGEQLKQITAEIKAIGRQGILLIGERVCRARELLKPYKNGTFTRWLETTFGTRKTGYNMLSFYELYQALADDELRLLLQKIPQGTAYILASRGGNLSTKAALLRKYSESSPKVLLAAIRETFPNAHHDKRAGKGQISLLISNIDQQIQKLRSLRAELDSEKRNAIAALISSLKQLL